MMKKNQIYKGFKVIETVEVPDCASKGIFLRHQRTGLEVFHLLNDDEENLFAFAFRTPSDNSSGVAHVLEHSVLCGSEKYPLRDVFTRLSNQNITTYLNAYTASDRTVFPASTTVKKEYFNLLSVYADTVFFPLLKPEVFMQECHRLELDENGKASIQGVVYNEMKGNYSSFDGVANDAIDAALFSGSSYEKDSGGDPLEIPYLTLQQVRAFHKKHYCPANCLLFLYGNIATEEQLDFIEKELLCRLKNSGKKSALPYVNLNTPVKHRVKALGPSDENNTSGRSVAALTWQVGRGADKEDASVFPLEMMFLGELLWGDDCAPVAKALVESGIGQDIAPQSGESIQSRYATMTIGLRGVEEKNAAALEKTVRECLKSLCKNGIPQKDIDRTCMTFDFSNREIKRFQGPYSLVLLRRVLRAWTYGQEPWLSLMYRDSFAAIKNRIKNEPDYISSLIEKYLLQNERYSLVTVTPSSAWTKKRIDGENKIIREQVKENGKKKIESELSKMHRFQNHQPTEEELEVIPRVKVSELTPSLDKIITKKSDFKGLPLFTNKEHTNGIVYVDIAFPVDTLPASEYPLIPLLASSCTQVGWGKLSWNEAISSMQSITGGFGAYTRTSEVPGCSKHLEKEYSYVGRDWLMVHFKVLEEQVEKAFSAAADFLTLTDFHDTRRLKDILDADFNSMTSSLIPYAHWYMMMRSCSVISRTAAVQEIWDGISSVYSYKNFVSGSVKKLALHLNEMFKKIRQGGAVIHITADASGLKLSQKCLPEFIERSGLTPLKKRYGNKLKDFISLTEIPSKYVKVQEKNKESLCDELFLAPGTVGFAASVIESSPFDTKDSIAEGVFAHELENGELWKAIRMKGGAYGVGFTTVGDFCCSRFMTYRDPKPFNSLLAFKESLVSAANRKFSPGEVEKAITGCYSSEIDARTPSGKGATGFLWELYGLSNAQKARRVKRLLSLLPKDLEKAAKRLSKARVCGKTVVLCGKELLETKFSEKSGKIITIPL